ncbi:hypothetical protein HGP17_18795 [Rhizobium sp. P38BS-XIX]|uniref:hypothetical protein n=1 Tax=Rhizobium sp. P38BS-XIX TaxID=2726740 RepID=UPI0014578DC5|nr:hypothetical protein [Rhizobium sp. P38BS-XIX]NLR98870.1 hypothetical protein [Rhizobium sp. P38BS-XIX]
MIPEYKLFHGAAICALIDQSPYEISIGPMSTDGRLGFYVVNRRVGLYIKHSTARLTPWPFAFSHQNIGQLRELDDCCAVVFVALVCGSNGIVCLELSELRTVAAFRDEEQPWLRVARRPGSMFSVSGNLGSLGSKKRDGFADIFGHSAWNVNSSPNL